MTTHYHVNSTAEAWKLADKLFPTDYEWDRKSTSRAGYPIYRSTANEGYYNYICDLADRLEVNLATGETINIWIDEEPAEKTTYDRLCWLAGHMCSVAVESAPGPMGGESYQRRLRQAIQYTDRVLSLYQKHVITENETVKMLTEIPR